MKVLFFIRAQDREDKLYRIMGGYSVGQFQISLQCFPFIHCEISDLSPFIVSCQNRKENNSHNDLEGMLHFFLLSTVSKLAGLFGIDFQ